MNDVFETNAVTNLILNTTIPEGVEEMPNVAPYPNTMTVESSNALRKLFNALCGSIDEILEFDTKSVESNSNHGVSKMLRFMIESLQNVNRNEEKDQEPSNWKDRKLYTWQANMDYVYACRKVAIFMINYSCTQYSEYEDMYDGEIPDEVMDNIIYILKIIYSNIYDTDALSVLKNIEILVCNNIDYLRAVMSRLNEERQQQ
jgi:hypothetical protein